MNIHNIKLPPLPKGDIAADTCPVMWVHTDEQLQEYALDAIEAVLQSPEVKALKHDLAEYIRIAAEQATEIQALRKDADRYRWLRDMIENQDLVIAKVGSWSLESWSGDDPDHYIDAAMEQQK